MFPSHILKRFAPHTALTALVKRSGARIATYATQKDRSYNFFSRFLLKKYLPNKICPTTPRYPFPTITQVETGAASATCDKG